MSTPTPRAALERLIQLRNVKPWAGTGEWDAAFTTARAALKAEPEEPKCFPNGIHRCSNCQSEGLEWVSYVQLVAAGMGPDKAKPIFVLGCVDCSETLRVMNAGDVATWMNKQMSTATPPAPYIDPQGEDADKQLLEVFYRQMGRGLEVHPETLLRGIRGVRAFQFASSSSRLAPADVQRIIEALDFCIGDSDSRANSSNHHRLRQRLKRMIATLPSPPAPEKGEGPTLADVDELCAEFGFHYDNDQGETLEMLRDMLSASLARWGHPPAAAPAPGENLAPPPAPEPGDVAELVEWIHTEAIHGPDADEWRRAATLLQQQEAELAALREVPVAVEALTRLYWWGGMSGAYGYNADVVLGVRDWIDSGMVGGLPPLSAWVADHCPPLPAPQAREVEANELHLREELDLTDRLLENREQVLRAIPECPIHGPGCVPHAMEWIERAKAGQVES